MMFGPQEQDSSPLDRLKRRETWVRLACISTFVNLSIILFFTLYPLNFAFNVALIAESMREIDWDLFQDVSRGRSYGLDLISNILLFAPFAVSWTVWQGLNNRASGSRVVFETAVICMMISICIECSQLLLPGRSTQLADVSTNTLGATIAALLTAGVLSEIDPQFKSPL